MSVLLLVVKFSNLQLITPCVTEEMFKILNLIQNSFKTTLAMRGNSFADVN